MEAIALEIAAIRTMVPAQTQYRVDNPCTMQHGSVGGWIKDGIFDQGFTIIWRPRGVFVKPGVKDVEAHGSFRETIVRNIRRETHAFQIVREDSIRMPSSPHSCDLLEYGFVVRKSLKRIELTRRQALWTCEETGRHIALEVTAATHVFAHSEPMWDILFTAMSCHARVGEELCQA